MCLADDGAAPDFAVLPEFIALVAFFFFLICDLCLRKSCTSTDTGVGGAAVVEAAAPGVIAVESAGRGPSADRGFTIGVGGVLNSIKTASD